MTKLTDDQKLSSFLAHCIVSLYDMNKYRKKVCNAYNLVDAISEIRDNNQISDKFINMLEEVTEEKFHNYIVRGIHPELRLKREINIFMRFLWKKIFRAFQIKDYTNRDFAFLSAICLGELAILMALF